MTSKVTMHERYLYAFTMLKMTPKQANAWAGYKSYFTPWRTRKLAKQVKTWMEGMTVWGEGPRETHTMLAKLHATRKRHEFELRKTTSMIRILELSLYFRSNPPEPAALPTDTTEQGA